MRPANRTINSLRVLLLLLVIAAPAGAALAASARQDETPLSPTPSATIRIPTAFPTATLEPIPAGGGRIAVQNAAIRTGPNQEMPIIGGLYYSDPVFPIGRDASGIWVALPFNGRTGWLSSRLVEWAVGMDLNVLPVLPENAILGASPASVTPPPSIARTPTSIPTPEPLRVTGEAGIIEPPIPATGMPVTATNTPLPGSTGPHVTANFPFPSGVMLGGGFILLSAALSYGWLAVSARQELRRYASGFVLPDCPVCQSGALVLDEKKAYTLGLPRVNRLVRCETCRSVLREVRPGTWRYAVDPLVNPDLATLFHGKQFTDEQLPTFAQEARQYPPHQSDVPAVELPGDLASPEEIISAIEARYIETVEEEARAAEQAEEQGADGTTNSEPSGETDGKATNGAEDSPVPDGDTPAEQR